MILAIAVGAGLLAGMWRVNAKQAIWQTPVFNYFWLVPVFFLPQMFVFYLPGIRSQIADSLVSVCLVVSLLGLLLFCVINKQMPGMPVLMIGLLLNLMAIVANGGLMPLSTQTAAHLAPPETLAKLIVGNRFGVGKDVLLSPETIIFPWLADRFVPPDWFPYQFAFSLGDVFIGIGAFLLISLSAKSVSHLQER